MGTLNKVMLNTVTLNVVTLNAPLRLRGGATEPTPGAGVDNWQWDDGSNLLWDDGSVVLTDN